MLCEARAIATGRPGIPVGGLNVELFRASCLAKGMSIGPELIGSNLLRQLESATAQDLQVSLDLVVISVSDAPLLWLLFLTAGCSLADDYPSLCGPILASGLQIQNANHDGSRGPVATCDELERRDSSFFWTSRKIHQSI